MRTPSKYIWADRDLTALCNPRAIPTRQIYKPRFARNNQLINYSLQKYLAAIKNPAQKKTLTKFRLALFAELLFDIFSSKEPVSDAVSAPGFLSVDW